MKPSETKKTFINAYFHNYLVEKEYLNELIYKLDQLQSDCGSVHSPRYTGTRSNSVKNNDDILASFITNMESLKSKISKQQKKVDKISKKHLKDIFKVEKANDRTVLRMYYLDGLSIEKIADYMQRTATHVYKIKRHAEADLYDKIN